MSLSSFVHDVPATRVVFGPGKRSEIPAEVERLDAERVLLIGDEGADAAGREIAQALGARLAGTFSEVVSHVPVEVVERAVTAATSAGADLLLTVGGGSAVGIAKAIARQFGVRILAVPTTYAGSEMTPIWGITENRRKTTGRDRQVVPVTVVYDPELTVTLSPEVTANSGMNALAHLVEGMYSPAASPVSQLTAREGISALVAGLPRVIADPADINARSLTLYGAWLGSWLLGTTTMGVHHTVCHVIGGLGAPHAQTHAAVLPYVALFNSRAAEPAMRLVKRALAQANRPATRAGVGLWELARDIGATTSLQELGLPEDALDQITDQVLEATPDNPRLLTRPGVRALLEAAYRGGPPTDIDG